MKSVPNLISYPHEFSQIFPHPVSIFSWAKSHFWVFLKKEKRWRVGPACQRLRRHAPRSDWLPGAALPSCPCLKGAVLTAPHPFRSAFAVRAQCRCHARMRAFASAPPRLPIAWAAVFHVWAAPPPLPGPSAVPLSERATAVVRQPLSPWTSPRWAEPRAPPCRLFLWVHLHLSFLFLPTQTQDPAGHRSTHLIEERRRRPGFPPFPSARSSGELLPPPTCLASDHSTVDARVSFANHVNTPCDHVISDD
jgi:hypothetical protein